MLDLLPIVVCLTIMIVFSGEREFHNTPQYWLDAVADFGLVAALLVRRRFPMTLLAVTVGWVVASHLLQLWIPGVVLPDPSVRDPWLPLAAPVACYTAAAHVPQRALTWILVVGLSVLAARPWAPVGNVVSGAVLMTDVAALIGLYFGVRRRLEHELRDRAERAEREQQMMADRARSEERARLAAEMHDVVTHRVSLMVLQAGALGVTAKDEATKSAAEDLRAAGCQALDELRDLVGVLQGNPGDAEHDGPVGSGGTVSSLDLAHLVDESDAAGASARLVEEGRQERMSPVVARTAYRIVQEALTNVRKHAPGAETVVHVAYGGDRVRLTVRNSRPTQVPDPGLVASGSGSGLAGLRQRVELVGGRFDAAQEGDGGFTVSAILPTYVPTKGAAS